MSKKRRQFFVGMIWRYNEFSEITCKARYRNHILYLVTAATRQHIQAL